MHKNRVKIPSKGVFGANRQIPDLTVLEDQGLIRKLKVRFIRSSTQTRIIDFFLCKALFILPDGRSIEVDFSEYRIKIEYGGFCRPRVFVPSHKLDRKCGHINGDSTLCLYKSQNFAWKNSSSLALEIIPLIYAWIYFYQDWTCTNIWYGFSAKH
jgi:hypothetical protein